MVLLIVTNSSGLTNMEHHKLSFEYDVITVVRKLKKYRNTPVNHDGTSVLIEGSHSIYKECIHAMNSNEQDAFILGAVELFTTKRELRKQNSLARGALAKFYNANLIHTKRRSYTTLLIIQNSQSLYLVYS